MPKPASQSAPGGHFYLSTDVEDVVVAASELHRRPVPTGYADNLGSDIERTLAVMETAGVHATYFVNGRYCEQYDELMREIVAQGHVLASHGHRHHDVRELGIDEFRDDLRRSIDALGKYQPRVIGYRPPAFTMPFDEEHLRVLVDEGIRYVSCGALFQRTNVPHHRAPVRLDTNLLYIPISMAYPLGRTVPYPVGYGHVSRMLPESLVVANVRRFARRADFFQFYFHPYEVNGLRRHTRRSLIAVNRKDIPQRVYSLRCGDRSRLFTRIFETCEFKPLESMEALQDGERMESGIS